MEKNIQTPYPMYDSVYGYEHPTSQYFVILMGDLPSRFGDLKTNYDVSIIDFLKDNGFITHHIIESNSRRQSLSTQLILVNKQKEMIIDVQYISETSKETLVKIDVYYKIGNGKLSEQFNLDEFKKFERIKKKANIELVKSDGGHLDTEEYDLIVEPMDLELNYGKDFLKVHDSIIKRLNKENDKGIILLHGDPGTGKTSYIKYLTTLVGDKKILFIPPSMAEMLSEPSIIPFLMDHRNSILIIEDAERVIADRESNGSPSGVSNILNLTDGILGDCLSIQVIATFNMKREKIDQALLRKGRLIAEHKFEVLSVENTNKLLKHIEKDVITTIPMSLADIYNIDVEVFRVNNKSKMGFNS